LEFTMPAPRTVHGIDLIAPGGLEALFAYNRVRFGAATMMAGEDPAPADPAPTDPAPADPTPVDPAPVDPAPPADDPWSDPERARAEITRLRTENAARRVSVQEAEEAARNEILTKLGLKKDDGPSDPAELARQLAAKDTDLSAKDERIRALTIERGLTKAARTSGADEDLLVAVLAHKGTLNKLDPSADDFTTQLEALVKAEVEANPKLRAVQVAPRNGADFSGRTGEGGKSNTPVPLHQAVSGHYGSR
jgi:hypothetical protein